MTSNFKISRVVLLIIYGKTNGYDVADHIATKVEVNPWILSTLKNKKSIWSMKPGRGFEKSMVRPLGILFSWANKQIWNGYFKSGNFFGRPFMRFFLVCINLEIETWPNHSRTSWEMFFERLQTVGTTISMFWLGLTLTN